MPVLRFLINVRVLAAAIALAVVAMTVGPVGGPQTALALTNCTVSDSYDAEEKAFLGLINQYRAQNGKSALTASTNLNRAAGWMARDMAVKKYFSHTDSANRSVSTRVANCGGKPSNGENIAAGTVKDTAAEAFAMWKASSGHNANMLNGSYKQIGIARYYDAAAPYRWYWVTDFSTTTDGTNAGGSSSPSPPAGPVVTKAVMTSPVLGARLATTQKFIWSAATNATSYRFYMGTSKGSSNLLRLNSVAGTSLTVSGLPRTGQTVWVRLYTQTSSGLQYNDYSYKLPN